LYPDYSKRRQGPPPLPRGASEPMRSKNDGPKILRIIVRGLGLFLIMVMASIGVGLVVGRPAAAIGAFLIMAAVWFYRVFLMPK